MNFKDFIQQQEQIKNIEQVIYEISYIQNCDNFLFEFKETGQILKKAGIHIKKGKGLIHYFKDIGKGLYQFFIAAIKGDIDKIKELKDSVKKEDVLDFLLKLDTATLHLITGPIHSVDAITGWHIWSNVQKTKEETLSTMNVIKKALETIKNKIVDFKDKSLEIKITKNISKIEKHLTKV